ncbi:MAG: hypothetical protein HWE19_12990 [Vibrionaceae bacterium]|nr:hypothetical protein [Vibrionaceae bacterium]
MKDNTVINNTVIHVIYSALVGIGLPFAANASSTIQNAVDLWTLNGQNFSSLKACSMQNELKKEQLFVYADSSCVISDLAAYTLLKECVSTPNIDRVSILDVISEKTYLSFDVSAKTCQYLAAQLDTAHAKLAATYAKTKKGYVIQFYSGDKEPASILGRCAEIPLYQHVEDNTFYLMSEAYERYSEAKQLMNSINEKCQNIDTWIRPVSITQF